MLFPRTSASIGGEGAGYPARNWRLRCNHKARPTIADVETGATGAPTAEQARDFERALRHARPTFVRTWRSAFMGLAVIGWLQAVKDVEAECVGT